MKIRWRVVGPVALVCSAAVWWVASTASTPPVALDPVAQASAGAPAPRDVAPAASSNRVALPSASRRPRRSQGPARAVAATPAARAGDARVVQGGDALPVRLATRRANITISGSRTRSSRPTRRCACPAPASCPTCTCTRRSSACSRRAPTPSRSRWPPPMTTARRLPLTILSSVSRSPQDTGGGKAAPLAPVVTQALRRRRHPRRPASRRRHLHRPPRPDGRGLRQLRRHDPHRAARAVRRPAGLRRVRRRLFAAGARHVDGHSHATWCRTARWTSCSAPTSTQPGRYVITGRVDDASGRPLALVTFNNELGAGAQQVPLQVYGRLVRDANAVFPLTLHDVEGFLLRPRCLSRPRR